MSAQMQSKPSAPHPATAPFDSLRDYVQHLERHGRLLRIPEMDQDQYEMTAFAYRL